MLELCIAMYKEHFFTVDVINNIYNAFSTLSHLILNHNVMLHELRTFLRFCIYWRENSFAKIP